MTPHVRPLIWQMRIWLLIDGLLVGVTGVQCFVLADFTAQVFAWTVQPPLTAAFLGASYWAALPMVVLSAREQAWARARVAIVGVLVFTAITLVATLLHLDRFHLSSPELLARIAAWAWLIVYLLVPPSLLLLLVLQLRVPGGDPPRTAPLPRWLRGVLVGQTAVLAPLGFALFVWPAEVAPAWPWALTPLTARVVGAWLIGMGITFAHAAWENDWSRVRAVMVAYTLLGGLQLVAVARFSDSINWNGVSAWLYVAMSVLVLVVGLYGWNVGRRALPQPARV